MKGWSRTLDQSSGGDSLGDDFVAFLPSLVSSKQVQGIMHIQKSRLNTKKLVNQLAVAFWNAIYQPFLHAVNHPLFFLPLYLCTCSQSHYFPRRQCRQSAVTGWWHLIRYLIWTCLQNAEDKFATLLLFSFHPHWIL